MLYSILYYYAVSLVFFFFFFQAEDGIRDKLVTGVQTCALPISGPVAPAAPLRGEERADVVIVGGGYAGLWTAWQLLKRGASVALLEAGVCGHGPSGRNGGFAETLWTNLPDLVERFGPERALAAARASEDSVRAIGAWCEAQAVDAWFRPRGFLLASAAEAQDEVLDRLEA